MVTAYAGRKVAPRRRLSHSSTVTPSATSPAERLHQLAYKECGLLRRELERAREGRDSAVHKARKTLQRIRSLLRLIRYQSPEVFHRLDHRLRTLRRRLGALRDAAVRVECAQHALDWQVDPEPRLVVKQGVLRLREQLAASWQRLPESFWPRLFKQLERVEQELQVDLPEQLDPAALERALDAARRRVRRDARHAMGNPQRSVRHGLRCHLRRYASMRRVCAQVLGRRDPTATRLGDFARTLGAEGDLWLTVQALRRCGEPAATRALRRQLEARRREACRINDGLLIALYRGALARSGSR